MLKYIMTEEEFSSEVLNRKDDKLVLVDFYADWCGPCKMMDKELQMLIDTKNENIMICKVNIDNEGIDSIVATYGIRGIPTLLFMMNKIVVHREVGYVPYISIYSKIEQLLSNPKGTQY